MIQFTSRILNNYLACYLNKDDFNFTLADLARVHYLEFDAKGIDKYTVFNPKALKFFPNAYILDFKNMKITNDLVEAISKYSLRLEELRIYNGTLLDLKMLYGLRLASLSINRTTVKNFSEITSFKQLSRLELKDMGRVDIRLLKNLGNLTHLSLSHTLVDYPNILRFLNKLKVLKIEYSNIDDLSFLESIEHIEELYLDKDSYIKHKDYLDQLNIKIYVDGILRGR